MKRNLLTIAVLGSALLMSAAALAQEAPKGSADTGKVTYNKACYTCHGTTGQGAAATGPRIGPTALQFAAFINLVRQPANQMVPFPSTVLSDQDVADIYAYLQSQKKEDYKQIPLLSHSE
jgi:mono/diheme cytochrome c family protein